MATIASGSMQFRVTWKKADKATLRSPIFVTTVKATQGWMPYQAQFVVPVGAVFCTVSFTNVDLNGTTWVDEVVATVL
jgi:hypothetical protein